MSETKTSRSSYCEFDDHFPPPKQTPGLVHSSSIELVPCVQWDRDRSNPYDRCQLCNYFPPSRSRKYRLRTRKKSQRI
ncbi:hypothetical protein CHS0354_034748 [Potamilus streckersoni]|uniref:Uncharacterized protein n=1 Tax=Potamilus streckersoni TaxID=2493646 RepID=A0AAE0RSY4_9BIVA|nr:hypothetical protein CHS0354_034748 [Potamilus streckersoni]